VMLCSTRCSTSGVTKCYAQLPFVTVSGLGLLGLINDCGRVYNLAKVDVAGSSPVSRSKKHQDLVYPRGY